MIVKLCCIVVKNRFYFKRNKSIAQRKNGTFICVDCVVFWLCFGCIVVRFPNLCDAKKRLFFDSRVIV